MENKNFRINYSVSVQSFIENWKQAYVLRGSADFPTITKKSIKGCSRLTKSVWERCSKVEVVYFTQSQHYILQIGLLHSSTSCLQSTAVTQWTVRHTWMVVIKRAWTNYLYRHQSKMSSAKKFTCKVTLRQVFIRVYRLEIHFRPSIVNCCPSNLFSGSTEVPQASDR